MDYELDNSHPLYIEMTVTGIVHKAGMIAALSELLRHPEYISKHTLWDFTGASMGLSIGDLKEIAGVLRLYKPGTKNFHSRSALLVPSMMELSMVKLYISISKLLPFDYKAFSDREEALAFLTA